MSFKEAMSQGTPWLEVHSISELEAWIALQNQELQEFLSDAKPNSSSQTYGQSYGQSQGQGICLLFELGGTLHIHTNTHGELLLDQSEDALWLTPVISAACQTPAPKGRIWRVSEDYLVKLLMGLNPLISSTQLVLQHKF
jgi:hypothetical protein